MEQETKIKVDLKTGAMTIDAPYGKAKFNTEEPGGWVKAIMHWIAQLEFYRTQGQDTDHVRRDLAGYKYLTRLGDDKLIEAFIDKKMEHRQAGRHYGDNIRVLAELGHTVPEADISVCLCGWPLVPHERCGNCGLGVQ